MLRRIAELLSRGRSTKRRLPSRFGRIPFYVSADAQLKYLKPGESAFDNELFRIIGEHIRENSVVWDIGANVGVFALGAASVAKRGSVLAVEADVWLAQLIRKSLQLKGNRILRLQVLPCAIADRNGVAKFLISNRGRASNALETAGGRSQSGGIRETVTVPTLTLDTLLDFFDSPSFVKIDVEGAEAMALRGACRLLSEVRPTIYIEVGRDANDEVSSIFHNAAYELFDGSIPIHEQRPVGSCTYNTLAIPKEDSSPHQGIPAST
jgi:FkbM family methyltransferase